MAKFASKKRAAAQAALVKQAKLDMRSQLGASDIVPAMERALGIRFTPDYHGKGPAYVLPYFDLDGAQLDFDRGRLLDPDAPHKYHQPAGSDPYVYLPPLSAFGYEETWRDIAADPSYQLYITEGEKKAACATSKGMLCIGLGGVWSFMCKRHHQALIPQLAEFEWEGREVVLAYDADLAHNENVARAADRLALALVYRGAEVYRMTLPDTDGCNGLDDHLVLYGEGQVSEYDIEPLHWQALAKFDARFHVYKNKIIDLTDSDLSLFSHSDMKVVAANITDEDGKAVFPRWIASPMRSEITGFATRPGEDRISEEGRLNTYVPPNVKPRKAPVTPYLDYIRRLSDGDREVAKYLIWFQAHKVARPGVRMQQAVLLTSKMHGTGKSTYGKMLRRLVGERQYSNPTLEQVTGRFAFPVLNGKTLVHIDESQIDHMRDLSNKLKAVITEDYIHLERKGVDVSSINNLASPVVTSNMDRPLSIEKGDRRYFICNTSEERWSAKEAAAFYRWLEKEGGYEALMYYFCNTVDLDAFDPSAPVPNTAAKDILVRASRDSYTAFCETLAEAPEDLRMEAREIACDFWTQNRIAIETLKEYVGPYANLHSLGPAMRRTFGDRVQVRLTAEQQKEFGRVKLYFYVVRNHEHWAQASKEEKIQHYREFVHVRTGPRKTPIEK